MINKLLLLGRKDLNEHSKDKDLSEINYSDLCQDSYKQFLSNSLVIFNDATDFKILK